MLYISQIVENGDLKSEGGTNEPSMFHWLTTILRPQEMQVGGGHFRREMRTVSSPGIRSGAEASSPTGDAGCLGIAGRRRSVTLHLW